MALDFSWLDRLTNIEREPEANTPPTTPESKADITPIEAEEAEPKQLSEAEVRAEREQQRQYMSMAMSADKREGKPHIIIDSWTVKNASIAAFCAYKAAEAEGLIEIYLVNLSQRTGVITIGVFSSMPSAKTHDLLKQYKERLNKRNEIAIEAARYIDRHTPPLVSLSSDPREASGKTEASAEEEPLNSLYWINETEDYITTLEQYICTEEADYASTAFTAAREYLEALYKATVQ